MRACRSSQDTRSALVASMGLAKCVPEMQKNSYQFGTNSGRERSSRGMMYNSAMSYAGDWKPKFLSKLKQTKVPKNYRHVLAAFRGRPSRRRGADDKSFRHAWEAAIARAARGR